MSAWNPTEIINVAPVDPQLSSSTGVLRVYTDDGPAYAKAIRSNIGPDPLICDFVGTHMAHLLGLPTFPFCVLPFTEELCDSTDATRSILPGPAFLTKAANIIQWNGTEDGLNVISNIDAIPGLVVLDTWLRNPDRYSVLRGKTHRILHNVVFQTMSETSGVRNIVAMDQSEAFKMFGNLSKSRFSIKCVRDTDVYGAFPEFNQYTQESTTKPWVTRLSLITKTSIRSVMNALPREWVREGLQGVIDLLYDFCVARASFVSDHILSWLNVTYGWPQSHLNFEGG